MRRAKLESVLAASDAGSDPWIASVPQGQGYRGGFPLLRIAGQMTEYFGSAAGIRRGQARGPHRRHLVQDAWHEPDAVGNARTVG